MTLEHLLQSRTSGNDPSQLLFLWECLNFFLTLEGQAGQIKDSWPALFFLWALWIYQPTAFWPPKVLMKNLLKIFLRSTCVWWVTSFSLLSRFSVYLWLLKFDYNVSLSMSFFQFILLGVNWTFWTFIFMYFINSQKFLALISSNSLFDFFYLLFLGLPQCVCWFTPTGH